ncbi:prohead protease/major capsid protein fusion protein [Desulforhopalus singaporensis]|uniref:Mu-like prophage major head subunit gpT n=1 Tax=Desulforhopalus singaporensis TaxID=91360 RepID=A0A1H0NSL1_9BACT|nr:prohead protease/major capsid protein fusion protein [Desulforhopalus singaporensis]SDO95661.1 hypothetical protein SAMN05660330_01428 [Desulforhopalus singaporensis]
MTKRQFYRSLSLRMEKGTPSTYDEKTRSVEVVVATEGRVRVYDWNRGVIDEILLMSGLEMPDNRQVPLLDTHSRYSSYSVIGSCRNMAVEKEELVGRAHFSTVQEAESQHTKVREGHLTDFSAGYEILEGGAIWVEDGESAVVDGRSFEGPVRVVSKWRIKELSVCPIGADGKAKARAESPAPQQEERLMDERLRAFLERRGLPKDATEEQAWEYFGRMSDEDQRKGQRSAGANNHTGGSGHQPAQIDPAVAAQNAIEAERKRSAEIQSMCRSHGFDDLAITLVADGSSIEQARKTVMDEILKRQQGDGGYGFRAPVEVGVEEMQKFRAASQDAIMVRAGVPVEQPAPGFDELAGRSLVDLARMSLIRSGRSDAGRPLDVVGRALTTSEFPVILGNTANLSLMSGWDASGETWQIWCDTGSVSNFLTHKQARASETSDLDEIPEGQEYKYGERSEAFEEYAIATYGKLFAITRQAIINDDIGALTDIPFAHGEAAARKVGDIVYAVPIANSVMGDGKALFIAAHNNILTGGVVSETTLNEGYTKMGLQKDIAGKRGLNISPEYFIGPKSIQGSAEIFFNSNQFAADNKGATRTNIYSGNKLTRVYDSRLDDDSTTAWYLAARKGKTVKVFFLDGIQKPYLEQKSGWSVDGVEHKVRIDAGAKAMDWRGLSKNAGA